MAIANTQPHESALYYEFSHLYDLFFGRVFYPRIVAGHPLARHRAGRARARDRRRDGPVARGVSASLPGDGHRSGARDARARAGPGRTATAGGTSRWSRAMRSTCAFADDSVRLRHGVSRGERGPGSAAMMAEAQRVCRPGGLLTIINHFRSPQPAVARMQRGIDPADPAARLDDAPPAARFSTAARCTSSGNGRRRAARCSRSWWRATRRRCRPPMAAGRVRGAAVTRNCRAAAARPESRRAAPADRPRARLACAASACRAAACPAGAGIARRR